jgi:hypothetical protein
MFVGLKGRTAGALKTPRAALDYNLGQKVESDA